MTHSRVISGVARVYKTYCNADAQQLYSFHIQHSGHIFNSLNSMADTFDPNFCFPVKELENDWMKLTPFNVRLHESESSTSLFIDENDRTISITPFNSTKTPDLHLPLYVLCFGYSRQSTAIGFGTTRKIIPNSTSTSRSVRTTRRSNSSEPSGQKESNQARTSSSMPRTIRC